MNIVEPNIGEIVGVEQETNHHEIFDSPYVRVYVARLKPGQETQYHSHTRDTMYVAFKGGKIQTVNHSLDEGCANILLKQYGLKYKMKLFIAKIRKKPLDLIDGFTFFMPSSSKKVIHKAIASRENNQEMVLVGIELKLERGCT